MIRGMIEAMLGDAGQAVLRFYEGHALVLSLVIIAYGLLMFFSWLNLVQIYRFLVAAAADILRSGADKDLRSKKESSYRHGRGRKASAALPWQEAVGSARFPLVSKRAGLLPVRKSVQAAQAIIDERELWQHARAVVEGADVRRISPAYRLVQRRQVETHGKD